MHCHYFEARLCRSCTHLDVPYDAQVAAKQARVAETLRDAVAEDRWLPPACSAESGFRAKVKLAVGGSVDAPTLGLNSPGSPAVDLRECPIQHPAIWQVVPDLAGFITHAGLEPYDVDARLGELKFVLVTANASGQLQLRFVVRTSEGVRRVRQHLPALRRRLPQAVAISANLHPEHKAVVEGDEEVALTDEQSLVVHVGDVDLHLQQRSFLQTNTDVAAALYRQVAQWADNAGARTAVDLFCGIGGFALHLARGGRRVHGVEIEPSAVAGARRSARELGLAQATFSVADAGTDASALLSTPASEVSEGSATGRSAPSEPAELVVVNPPRRGIGDLTSTLEASAVRTVVYSSCNPSTLALDLARMPSYRVTAARLFDMFPHTDHAEVAVMLQREKSGPAPR